MLISVGNADTIETERQRQMHMVSQFITMGFDLANEVELDGLTWAREEAFGSIDIPVNNTVIRYFHDIV